MFGVFYGCDPKNVTKARIRIQHHLVKMRKEPVTSRELRQAKTLLLRQMLLERTSTGSIAEEFLRLSLTGLPLDEPARAAQRYRKITAQQVRKAFKRWISPENFAQVTRGPNSL